MGLHAYLELLAALRKASEAAFFPKVVPDASHPNGFRFEWPDGLNFRSVMLEDVSGRLRGLVLSQCNDRSPATRAAQGQAAPPPPPPASFGDEEELAEDVLEPIDRPSALKRVVYGIYDTQFRQRGVTTLYAVFDHIGRTPEIKRILQAENKKLRPVEWPADRATLFTGDHPFRNTIHEYVMDREAKQLLWDYLATALLDEFPAQCLPECCELVVWGARYRGADMEVPHSVSRDVNGVLSGVAPLKPTERIPYFPRVEADVAICYLVKAYLGRRNIVVTSRDNDFVPALLSIYSQAMRAHVAGELDAVSPTGAGLFILRKVLAKAKVKRELVPPEMLAKLKIPTRSSSNSSETCSSAAGSATSGPAAEGEELYDDVLLQAMEAAAAGSSGATVQFQPQPQPQTEQEQQEGEQEEDDALDWLEGSSPGSKRANPREGVAPLLPSKKAKTPESLVLESDLVEIKEKIVEVIDMGRLFKTVWQLFYNAHQQCQKCDPIDVFALICFMSGSDYFKKLPGISWNKLCATYLDYDNNRRIGCMCPRGALSKDGVAFFRLDYGAFTRFVALAYAKTLKPAEVKDKANYGDVRSFLKRRAEAAAAKRKPAAKPPKVEREPWIPPEAPQNFAARIAWVMNYYTRSHQLGWVFTSGVETDAETGAPLYGYSKSPKLPKGIGLSEWIDASVQLKMFY